MPDMSKVRVIMPDLDAVEAQRLKDQMSSILRSEYNGLAFEKDKLCIRIEEAEAMHNSVTKHVEALRQWVADNDLYDDLCERARIEGAEYIRGKITERIDDLNNQLRELYLYGKELYYLGERLNEKELRETSPATSLQNMKLLWKQLESLRENRLASMTSEE